MTVTADENATGTPMPARMSSRWFNAENFDPNDKWAGFDPGSAAVVVVDLINWQAHRDGGSIASVREAGQLAEADYLVQRCETLVAPTLKRVLSAARAAGVKVVHARLASRSEDFSDVVPAFRAYLRAGQAADGSWSSQIIDGLYEPTDVSIVKSASGAFNSSDLDQVLRNLGVRTVVYAGVLTDACVLLTAAAGFDLGYRQYLLTDCTAALSDHDQVEAERIMNRYLAQTITGAEAVFAFETRRVDSESVA